MRKPRSHTGFEEHPQSDYKTHAREGPLKALPTREVLKIGEGGRLVIPAAMREQMGIAPGDMLVAHVEDGELKLVSRKTALRRIRQKAAARKKPGESVVDEFLAERRAMWGEE